MGLSAYAAIAGGLFLAIWKYPPVALAGVLCMFGLEQWGQATTTFFAQHHTATNLFIGGILVLALLVHGVRKGATLFSDYPPVGWLILLLFLYAFASAQWAPRADLSLGLWASRWPYVVTIIILSPLLITHPPDLRSANIGFLAIGGLLTMLLLFLVKWDHRRIVLDHDLGNPLAVSSMAGMVAIVAVLADPWPKSKLWFPIKWVLVGLCLALVVRSGSRGQLLGTILISVACWPISRQMANMRQYLLLGIFIVFIGAATGWAVQEYSSEQTYNSHGGRWSEASAQEDVSGRLNNAVYLVGLAFQSPESIMIGLGNSASYDPRILGIYPHFVPFEVLAEEGLIGFSLYLTVLLSTMRTCYRGFRSPPLNPQDRAMFGALVGLFLFTLLLSLKQGSLLLNLEPFMLAIILERFTRTLNRKLAKTNRESEDTIIYSFAPSSPTAKQQMIFQ